ncbi:MAG TPA: hypothetical protein EYH10_05410 [Deltaproteobacteria bacterium]|nr:hypothetical protein [Deltaproteobacteria bacterium]
MFHPRSLAEPEQRRDVSEAQAIAALLALEIPNLTCTDLEFILNRDLSGLSQAAGRLRKRMVIDFSLTTRLDEIKRLLKVPTCQACPLLSIGGNTNDKSTTLTQNASN